MFLETFGQNGRTTVNKGPQNGLFFDNSDVLVQIGGRNELIAQFLEVGHSSDVVQVPIFLQMIAKRDGINGNSRRGEFNNAGIDDLVFAVIEILSMETLEDLIYAIGLHEHRPKDSDFCVVVGWRYFIEHRQLPP